MAIRPAVRVEFDIEDEQFVIWTATYEDAAQTISKKAYGLGEMTTESAAREAARQLGERYQDRYGYSLQPADGQDIVYIHPYWIVPCEWYKSSGTIDANGNKYYVKSEYIVRRREGPWPQ